MLPGYIRIELQPDITFYQGLALIKLEQDNEARSCFGKLVDFGMMHRDDHVGIDYFAVSLPDLLILEDDLDKRNSLLCRYLMGLGYPGLGDRAGAIDLLMEVVAGDLYHVNATKHLYMAGQAGGSIPEGRLP